MFLVKKKWGAPHGLSPEAVLLEDANGTSLSDGSIPEEMGWTIASRGDLPVCTVYALPKFNAHAQNPQAKAGRPSSSSGPSRQGTLPCRPLPSRRGRQALRRHRPSA